MNDSGKGVTVTGIQNGISRSFNADYVICTLPAPVLEKVLIEPSLPVEKRDANDNMPYLDITRTYLQVEKPFWLEKKISANAVSDLLTGQVAGHLNSLGAENNPALLENMVAGRMASEMAEMPQKDLIQKTLQDMKKVHPEVEEHFQKGHSKAWSEDPYAMGGPSWPAPGDVKKYLKPLQRPHGRIHFAGEHTSILRSTMEGALRSGVRAAMEVHTNG